MSDGLKTIADAIHRSACGEHDCDLCIRYPEAEDAARAVIRALGLVEERCCDDPPDDYRFMSCAEFGEMCITRLAQPWPERQS